MTSEQYDQEVQKTRSAKFHAENVDVDILHGAIGLVTESGELLDSIKKALFYGKPLDITNVIEELGDLSWYMSLIRTTLGISQEQVQQINVDKLKARYGGKFSEEKALNRDLDNERSVLEGK